MENVKFRVRKLKKLEIRLRWGDKQKPGTSLVWDSFFDLHDTPAGLAKYFLKSLTAMSREEYKQVVAEFFSRVYYEYYLENGITGVGMFDPLALAALGLPVDADRAEVRKRFRELAKKHHPDTGGNAADFIELMKVYERLTGGM